MLARLPRSWSAALDQIRRDVTMVASRARGQGPSPLVKRAAVTVAATVVRPKAEPRQLVVERVVRETSDAVTLVMRPSDAGALSFLPGQFFTVLTRVDGEIVPRNYSASNAPGSSELHLTIKKKAGGRVSGRMCELRAGDRLDVLGPFGSFVVEPSPDMRRRLVLVAGGAGITPLASIARAVLAVEPASEIAIIYANRTAQDVIFASELDALARAHEGRLTIVHVRGRVDRHTLARSFVRTSEAMFYVCGPDGMRDEVLAALSAHGIDDAMIRIERFAIGPRPQLTVSSAAIAASIAPGSRPIAIRVKDQTVRTSALPGATLLEAGLAAGAPMPFSCGVGGCGSCRVRLTSGDVELEEPNCLSEAERVAGYVLACVGRPCGPCTIDVQ